MIALYLTKQEKLDITSLSSNIKFEGGSVSLTSLTTERFKEIFGGYDMFLNKLGKLRDVVKEISFTAYFAKRLQKEAVEKMFQRYGLKGYTLITAG
jgi:hypothetical protein